MKNQFLLVLLALLSFIGCEDEPLPPCQLSQSGWVCTDLGSSADLAGDNGTNISDMDSEEMSIVEDVGKDQSEEMDMIVVTTPKSCSEVKERNLPTGDYEIELDGVLTRVHCNSDVDGGGWMLVGRSVAGGNSAFGWRQKAGNIDDDTLPFSLGSLLPFEECLATNYSNGKTPGDRQYIVTLPENFLADCANASCPTTVRSPTNSCPDSINGNNVFMFDYVGWVSTNQHFWFREIVADAGTGFKPDGWDLFFPDCRAGELDEQQGLLFVR